ncbi:MAG: radical SAM family heme chaperone HemW [Paludibacteraceae bacterium]|nr:radical SAM family heme chaperone HemW [Paludibacteraceae bacterium]
MSGIYIHIPFCKKRCAYCDFFSTTLLNQREEYVKALLKEIVNRKDEANEPIRTIYIGGGTPSTLEPYDISRIMATIDAPEAEEITMEMNPGDVTPAYLKAIKEAGINRLSIGIQSFQDPLLALIGRRHNAEQALTAVRNAKKAGFDNISIDLMYALPTQTMSQWEADIETAVNLEVQHISSYGLIYEEGTALTQRVQNGELEMMDEDSENAMYDRLCERLKKEGFVHYEVSNFALPGYESKHNSSYWNGTQYVGVGAGAHSYIGVERSWNPDDLNTYIRNINNGTLVRESETLTDKDRYNEQIMLGLRTNHGIDEAITRQIRGKYETILDFTQANLLTRTAQGRIVATQKGLHILNRIIEELMI